jgi:hypothetical protein
MNAADFLTFRTQLTDNLTTIDCVTGVAFVGSAAETSRADEWSDHDFFVFTTTGTAESLRQDISWLPNHGDIALFVRETEHGLKVIYTSGHVLEFAIFEDDWELSGVNSYEVTLDRGSISERLKMAQARSFPKPLNVGREFSLFLANLLIGTGRYRRGEVLSSRQFINGFCLNSVIKLVCALLPAEPSALYSHDNQNSSRRFEIAYPQMAQELEEIQRMDPERSAHAMLEFVIQNLLGHFDQNRVSQISAIKARLDWP